jgi:hypothetical protein
MHAALDALSSTFIKTTCKGQAWVGSKHAFVGISWWHVKQVEQESMDMTQRMKHQVEGPIMQKRSGRERLGGATRGARGQGSHGGEMIVLEENRARGEHAATQAGRPRPAGLPYLRSPPGSRLLHASFPLLPQFVCSSLCAQNHRRHSQPSQA